MAAGLQLAARLLEVRVRSVSSMVGRLVLATAVLLTGTNANGAVLYTLTGSINPLLEFAGPIHEQSFRFTSDDFITSYLALSAADLDSCVNCSTSGTTIEFWPAGLISTEREQISFWDGPNGVVYGFFFEPGVFSQLGVHTAADIPFGAIGNLGTLTVRRVPEPSSVLMMLAGVLALRRFRGRSAPAARSRKP
jgi:hypothetical protein